MDPETSDLAVNCSKTIGAFAAALAKAQAEMHAAPKEADNPFFKSKYADLPAVWEAVRGPLTKNEIAVTQIPRAADNRVTVTTLLIHSSGEWLMGDLTVVAKDGSPQSVGSAITYARRYALSAMAGVVADADDDGEAAQGRPPAAAGPGAKAPKAGEKYQKAVAAGSAKYTKSVAAVETREDKAGCDAMEKWVIEQKFPPAEEQDLLGRLQQKRQALRT